MLTEHSIIKEERSDSRTNEVAPTSSMCDMKTAFIPLKKRSHWTMVWMIQNSKLQPELWKAKEKVLERKERKDHISPIHRKIFRNFGILVKLPAGDIVQCLCTEETDGTRIFPTNDKVPPTRRRAALVMLYHTAEMKLRTAHSVTNPAQS